MNARSLLIQLFLLLASLPLLAANRYIITFDRLDSGSEERIRHAGGTVIRRLERYHAIAANLPGDMLDSLRRTRGVKNIEPDPERHLLSQKLPYGIPMVQADLVSGEKASNRKVCVIDSGYFKQHKDLQDGNVTAGISNNLPDPLTDGCGHGTHVSGVIAALDNSLGVVGVIGSGKLNLHIIKLFDNSCEATFASDVIAAVEDCVREGANVVNMSLGSARRSTLEEEAMNDAFAAGVLLVAAAGNDGTNDFSFPASYDSVISVGAIDAGQKIAEFSQRNKQVELVAPGVAVLSTVPFIETNTAKVDGKVYKGNWIQNAKRPTSVSGNLVDGGLCDASQNTWNGKVVLCERGVLTFNEKVMNVQKGNGIAAIIYNNVPGNFSGTLGEGNFSSIPAISFDQQTGQLLVAEELGLPTTIVSKIKQPASGYAEFLGTSFSAPHVAGVAALIWSRNPGWTNVEIRKALQKTAKDLGKKGRDKSYGFGLVQAADALQWLLKNAGS